MKTLISYIVSLIIKIRFLLYKYHILKTNQFNIPIISIGNIIMGGTSKTPMVSWLINQCENNGYKVCIITRGYKRNKKDMIIINGSLDNKPNYTSKDIGDEPKLLLNQHPKIHMVVGNNKVQSIQYAIKNFNVDIIIMDDGFQSLYINRDIDIVMTNADTPNSYFHIFPRGYARESYNNINRADFVVINKSKLSADTIMQKIINNKMHKLYANKNYKIKNPNNYLEFDEIKKEKLLAVCGIANPSSFFDSLKQKRLNIKKKLVYRDHHQYSIKDIKYIYTNMKENNIKTIITTSKDYNKICELNFKNKKIILLDMFLQINDSLSLMSKIKKTIN